MEKDENILILPFEDVRSVLAPRSFQALKQKMEGWAIQLINQIASIPEQLTGPFSQPDRTGPIHIKVTLKPPVEMAEVKAAIDALRTNPEALANLARMYQRGL